MVSLCSESVHGVLASDLGAGPRVLTGRVLCIGPVEPDEALLVVLDGAEAEALVAHDEGVAEVPVAWSCSCSGDRGLDLRDVLVGRVQEDAEEGRGERDAAGKT